MIINKHNLSTEQLISDNLKKALEMFCMYEEELDILIKNVDIRGYQLYINVTEEFKIREFYLQWNMTRFLRLDIYEIYFRNNNFDKPVRIHTHRNYIKEVGSNYMEFNEGLVVWSNNRIISI